MSCDSMQNEFLILFHSIFARSAEIYHNVVQTFVIAIVNAAIFVISAIRSRYSLAILQAVRTRAGALGSGRRCPESFPTARFINETDIFSHSSALTFSSRHSRGRDRRGNNMYDRVSYRRDRFRVLGKEFRDLASGRS